MRFSKAGSISIYSIISKFISVIIGPVTVFLVSKKLSLEEIGFYYTFFNLIAMQQLAEVGIGHTIKQFITHNLKNNRFGFQSKISKFRVNGYYRFANKWFLAISLFIVFFVGTAGYIYYSSYNGPINWQTPWFLFILVSAVSNLFVPLQLFGEAIQKQTLILRARLVSSFFSAGVLWFCLYMNAGLYSIVLSTFVSAFILNAIIYKEINNVLHDYRTVKLKKIKYVFYEIWPLLSKVSIVWLVGFFFWNGFNLVLFKVLALDFAGKIIYTLNLIRTIYFISDSPVSSQMTLYSKYISDGETSKAREVFVKYRNMSILLYLAGIGFYVSLKVFFPNFSVFTKTIDLAMSWQMFLFFFMLLLLTTNNNFVRCFKIEPFVYVSVFHGVMTPVLFYITLMFDFNYSFLISSLVISCSLVWSFFIAKSKVNIINL